MNSKVDLEQLSANIVYLRPVETASMPEEVQDQAEGLETLFSMHNEDGEQVALVASPLVAGHFAEQNNLIVVPLQ